MFNWSSLAEHNPPADQEWRLWNISKLKSGSPSKFQTGPLRLWNVAHCLAPFGGGVKRGRQQVVTKQWNRWKTPGAAGWLWNVKELRADFSPGAPSSSFLCAYTLKAFAWPTLHWWPATQKRIWQISSGMWVQQLSQKNLHTLKFLWRSKWIPNIEMIQSLLGMWMDYEGANGCWSPTFAHTSPSAPTWLYFVST